MGTKHRLLFDTPAEAQKAYNAQFTRHVQEARNNPPKPPRRVLRELVSIYNDMSDELVEAMLDVDVMEHSDPWARYTELWQSADAVLRHCLNKLTPNAVRAAERMKEGAFANLESIRVAAARKGIDKTIEKLGNRAGYVYLIQSPTGAYKIGRTKNPADRMKTFSVKLPFEVEYVCLIRTNDMYAMEADIHAVYASKRIKGEWFALTPDDVEQIKEMATP